MPRLFQLSDARGAAARAIPPATRALVPAPAPLDEDIALGWECAAPALQIDCWAPQAVRADEGLPAVT